MAKNRTSWNRLSVAYVCCGLVIILLGSTIPIDGSFAAGRYRLEEWNLPKFYPKGFDGYGILEGILDEKLIISDSEMILSPRAAFFTRHGQHPNSSAFRLGDTAGYLLNSDGEIVSLWLIKTLE